MSRDATFDPVLHRGRRQRLLDALGGGVLLLPTAPETVRNSDVQHEYRPGSDFHYLTGFPEPEAVLVAWPTRPGQHHAVLFVRLRDPAREVWDGHRFGPARARRRFGVDAAFPIAELWQRLPELMAGRQRLLHRLGVDTGFDRRLLDAFAAFARKHRRRQLPVHPAIVDPIPALAALRRTKDAAEVASLRQAANISATGHLAAMRAVRPGMPEYAVQAVLEAEFRSAGSPRNGYPSIVASGANACVLHYHDNDRVMRAGELLLIDAGAEFGGNTADITRTFPVSGRFSAPQAAAYRVVLRAQLAGIRACRAGAPWDAAHRTCVRWLTKGLLELGVLRGSLAQALAKEWWKPWYMHGTSHWLGRDVHDVGAYLDARNRPERLPVGAVLTVEPGLYFGPRDRRVPMALRGIGIRIEDDVLVTAKGPVVLTEAAPKSIQAIESACSSPRS